MTLEDFDDDEVMLMARALSIHRVSMRRKINRLKPGSNEHRTTLAEIEQTSAIVAKLNREDLQRVSAA